MVRYRRNFVPGGTYFFTVTLFDRRSSDLVDHIGALRAAFRVARRERPFMIDAIAILPDHPHAIFTLPVDDKDFSGRWRVSRAISVRACSRAVMPSGVTRMANLRYGNAASGNTQSATRPISSGTSTTFTSIR